MWSQVLFKLLDQVFGADSVLNRQKEGIGLKRLARVTLSPATAEAASSNSCLEVYAVPCSSLEWPSEEQAMSLRQEMRRLLADAKDDLRRDGDLVPRLLVHGKRESALGFIEFASTPDERRLQLFAVGTRLAHLTPIYTILVSDAYMRVADENEPLELPLQRSLADDPQSVEAIVVTSLDERGRSRFLVAPYERHPDLKGLTIEFMPVPAKLPRGRPDAYLLSGFWEGVRAAKH